ncbi:MAG TPA: alkaline phosphatase family protein [Solirubrobacteraceae bacterium]|nr:alkaline phosphatase family protein [Solirubrobacteraceae bacterium]
MLRYVGESEATVWLETDSPCEVEVLGRRARTFQVAGHHYAIVVIEGLARDSVQEYEVALDGERRWPQQGSALPRSVIRTPAPGADRWVAFGSCSVTAPPGPPYSLPRRRDRRGLGIGALYALAHRLLHQPHDRWPDLLLLVGDQVYADEVSPAAQQFIRPRRDIPRPPGQQVADFEEYTRLYHEAWGYPLIRWMASTVATAMIFDDHDLHDDWNTSAAWVATMRAKPWWEERIVGAFMSYWIYQHLGNLSPDELAAEEPLRQVTATEDGTEVLRQFALKASHETAGRRWSYSRGLGRSRLVVIDSRAGRVLEGRRRSMLDAAEWEWLERQLTGGVDHLLIATSLPLLLSPGLHHLEAWNEAVCAGAWGRRLAAIGEQVRQRLDLEHWAAFERSFTRLVELIRAVAAGERGAAPASIGVLSGDVHHGYLAEAAFVDASAVQSSVYQAVCSPFRHPLAAHERAAVRATMSRPATVLTHALARAAGVADPAVRWRSNRPTFDNQVATLVLSGRHSRLTIERTGGDWRDPRLEPVLERTLT